MDKRLWFLRAITDWTLIVVAWFSILSMWGWSAALLLAAYVALIMSTEWDIIKEEIAQVKSSKNTREKEYMYPLENGEVFIGTPEEYAQFLRWQKEQEKVEDGQTERTKDEV